MRLIDADKLKEELSYKSPAQDFDMDSVILGVIDEQPTVNPWHRVDERPDEHTNLWLHDERGNYHVGCISTYRGYTEYIDMGGNTLHDIDYWMPIELPKEGNDA